MCPTTPSTANQKRLKIEKAAAQRLYDIARIQTEEIDGALGAALARADHPHIAYSVGSGLERRVMTGSFFERIEIGPDEDVTGTTLTPVYRRSARRIGRFDVRRQA